MAYFPCNLSGSGEDIPVIAANFDTNATYNKEDVVLYNGLTYICNTDGVTGAWNSSYWDREYIANLTKYNANLGGKAPELIWTNPTPTLSFASQTINLDLSKYDGILVEFRESTSTDLLLSRAYIKKSDETEQLGGGSRHTNGRGCARKCYINSNGVYFGEGVYGTTNDNTIAVPTKIYGVYGSNVDLSGAGELLWTNSSPSSTFNAQTISLDLSGYEAVLVCSDSLGTSANDLPCRCYAQIGEVACLGRFSNHNLSSTPYAAAREFTAKVTGVEFYDCYNANSKSNMWAIPCQIYGIKKRVI